MNALEAFAASAWYLTLMGRPRRNCSEPHKHIAALVRRGYTFVCCDYSPYLPRSPGEGDVISRLWQGRHSSGMMLLIRLASTPGLRHKSMDGREQVSLSPALSSRPRCHNGSEACGGRSGSLHCLSWRRASCRYHAGSVLITPYIQFSRSAKNRGKVSFTYRRWRGDFSPSIDCLLEVS